MSSIGSILDNLRDENMLREIPPVTDRAYLDLSGNDYLALASRRDEFMEEFLDRFPDVSFTSSASRLLSTQQEIHHAFERYLGSLYDKQVLLFNSGYHANVGCIGALNLPSTLFVCDKLIHASVIDGLHVGGCEFRRFPHNNIVKLRRILDKESASYERLVVVAESIYSMDGDEAPLRQLADLKKDFPGMLLYVDEAHAFGVRGSRGLGCAEQYGLIGDIDLLIGTFGKAAASSGAFAAASPEIKSLLINKARPFIFSTALPPINVAWSMLMTEHITDMSRQREDLARVSTWFRHQLTEISANQDSPESTSQIVPLLTGDAARALRIAGILRENGILALPIRRPTVPPGGERIRFSLTAGMTERELNKVVEILKEVSA